MSQLLQVQDWSQMLHVCIPQGCSFYECWAASGSLDQAWFHCYLFCRACLLSQQLERRIEHLSLRIFKLKGSYCASCPQIMEDFHPILPYWSRYHSNLGVIYLPRETQFITDSTSVLVKWLASTFLTKKDSK